MSRTRWREFAYSELRPRSLFSTLQLFQAELFLAPLCLKYRQVDTGMEFHVIQPAALNLHGLKLREESRSVIHRVQASTSNRADSGFLL